MRILRTLAAVSVAAVTAGAASAQDYTLTIASWAPPTHGFNSIMWPNFIERLEEVTDGRVTAEVKLGLVAPPAMMDLVLDGGADFTIIFNGYNAGRFVTTQLPELPGYVGTSEQMSVAYWRVYKEFLEQADEHRGVKVVGLTTHGPAFIQTDVDITGLDDVNGLKLRVPGGVGSRAGEALGAVGIQVPAPKVYETLASKAADGVVMPIEGRDGFKLTEVAANVYNIPGGLYRGAFAVLMSEETFADLPEDIQAILEAELFGEPTSRMFGAAWDVMDADGYAATEATEGNSIIEPTAADLEKWDAIKADIIDAVLDDIAAAGVDARAAYAALQAELSAMN